VERQRATDWRHEGDLLAFFETGGVPLNCCFNQDKLYVTDFGTYDTTSGKVEMVGALKLFYANAAGQSVFRGSIEKDVF